MLKKKKKQKKKPFPKANRNQNSTYKDILNFILCNQKRKIIYIPHQFQSTKYISCKNLKLSNTLKGKGRVLQLSPYFFCFFSLFLVLHVFFVFFPKIVFFFILFCFFIFLIIFVNFFFNIELVKNLVLQFFSLKHYGLLQCFPTWFFSLFL